MEKQKPEELMRNRPLLSEVTKSSLKSADSNISIGTDEIENRFGYHRPTPENASAHIDLRLRFRRMAEDLDALVPPSRAKYRAFEALQEASMWSHFAIAELAPVVSD